MFASRQGLCRPEAAHLDLRPEEWRRRTFRAAGEVPALLDDVVAALEALGYPRRDLFAVRLALEEALVNAVKHGNRGNPAKEARLRYHAGPEFVLLEVEDEGEGFDPFAVPDPLAPENLERPSGRGLFLIRKYMTWVEYSERGNRVTMCKHRGE
jgi:serine/threonine-protein kinase RsbW